MSTIAKVFYNYQGSDPFKDSQGRNFTDSKIIKEFYPISKFWTLFNNNHEILIGTRGSGKTFLLKMMRRSMLRQMHIEESDEIVSTKEFASFYVPMHLEFVTELPEDKMDSVRRCTLFTFLFNCLLAESIVSELEDILQERTDRKERVELNYQLAVKIAKAWFEDSENVMDLSDVCSELQRLYYHFDFINDDISLIPVVFRQSVCSPLITAQNIIKQAFGIQTEPTWIVCLDEAEFIPESFQRILNGFMRSDSHNIALKIATLPFHYLTLGTQDENCVIAEGNDFNFQFLDMKYDDLDFIGLTDKLCANRLAQVDEKYSKCTLKDFLGSIGDDKYIDYYKKEIGAEEASDDRIYNGIVEELSDRRKKGSENYGDTKKTIRDKYAPIYYIRKMKIISNSGNRIPGWYAGADMVRRISQGNPRMFINIMSGMFAEAKKASKFGPKTQNKVLTRFSKEFCNSTKALEKYGPTIYQNLDLIAKNISEETHGKKLTTTGYDFVLRYAINSNVDDHTEWLQKAIAYSRLSVSNDVIRNGINEKTIFTLSNAQCAIEWIPMRKSDPTRKINVSLFEVDTNNTSNRHVLHGDLDGQLSIFLGGNTDDTIN